MIPPICGTYCVSTLIKRGDRASWLPENQSYFLKHWLQFPSCVSQEIQSQCPMWTHFKHGWYIETDSAVPLNQVLLCYLLQGTQVIISSAACSKQQGNKEENVEKADVSPTKSILVATLNCL